MAPPLYQIRSLEQRYAGRTVLKVDRLDIAGGAIVGLVGPNGSGKSTLLRLLGGIEAAPAGEIRFGGQPLRPFSEHARFQISLLPQEPYLMRRSVFNNVAYGLRLRGGDDPLEERIHEALGQVGLDPGRFARRPWYALSGGETQRVALAARLALRPKVLLMDEPTASVDAYSAQLIQQAAVNARERWGTTLVVASHDRQWLGEVCDDLLHLFNGRLVRPGGETFVFGPWEKGPSGVWGKPLGKGIWLTTDEPPDPEACAVLEVLSVDGDGKGAGPGVVSLEGTVTHLHLEHGSRGLFAFVQVGGLGIRVRLSGAEACQKAILPGNSLFVHYRPDRVKWISAT